MGTAALATVADRIGVSLHISTEYLAAVYLGDTALIEARVVSKGSRTGIIEVESPS